MSESQRTSWDAQQQHWLQQKPRPWCVSEPGATWGAGSVSSVAVAALAEGHVLAARAVSLLAACVDAPATCLLLLSLWAAAKRPMEHSAMYLAAAWHQILRVQIGAAGLPPLGPPGAANQASALLEGHIVLPVAEETDVQAKQTAGHCFGVLHTR